MLWTCFMLMLGCGPAEQQPDPDPNTREANNETTTPPSTTGPTTPTGTAPLVVESVEADCVQQMDTGFVFPTSVLRAQSQEGGVVEVRHDEFALGCCPTLTAQARVDYDAHRLEVLYNLSDQCDCTCILDAGYRLVGVPSGGWTLTTSTGDDVQVTVP